jgi:acyl-ACP thioesterase
MYNSDIKYQETFKIRASEVDFNQKATLPAICDLLQEVAGNHAQELNFDITDLQKEKLTWVLHRLCVKMNRFPDWRDSITIQTWPSSGDGLRAYRDFLILDADGNTIGKSLSYWLMMNTESRKPSRIPKKILNIAPDEVEHVLPVDKANFPEMENSENKRTFEVRKSDLDLNRHVNNVRYIEWAIACLPDKTEINEIDIQFKSESVLGDTINATAIKNSGSLSDFSYIHQLKRASDQEILARALTK